MMAPNNYLLPNPMAPILGAQMRNTLNLNQIEGFTPVTEFVDESNTKWVLVKSSFDSTLDIPDPKNIQVVDYWNHAFPGIKAQLYIYVVEGIKQPRVETEQPTKILYQWFSPVFVPTFTPQMITEREWLKANVYAAPVVNARVSKLNALCKVTGTVPAEERGGEGDKLLKVEELTGGFAERNKKPNGRRQPDAGGTVPLS